MFSTFIFPIICFQLILFNVHGLDVSHEPLIRKGHVCSEDGHCKQGTTAIIYGEPRPDISIENKNQDLIARIKLQRFPTYINLMEEVWSFESPVFIAEVFSFEEAFEFFSNQFPHYLWKIDAALSHEELFSVVRARQKDHHQKLEYFFHRGGSEVKEGAPMFLVRMKYLSDMKHMEKLRCENAAYNMEFPGTVKCLAQAWTINEAVIVVEGRSYKDVVMMLNSLNDIADNKLNECFSYDVIPVSSNANFIARKQQYFIKKGLL